MGTRARLRPMLSAMRSMVSRFSDEVFIGTWVGKRALMNV